MAKRSTAPRRISALRRVKQGAKSMSGSLGGTARGGKQRDRLHVSDLKPLAHNARRRTERGADMIADSLRRFGAARSIVIDEDDMILAGNGTTEAAALAGISGVRVVEADGHELIAVRRRGLTPDEKAALALADNRTAELAQWDPAILAQLSAALPDVTMGLWTPEELRGLLAGVLPAAPDDPGAQLDKADELQRQWHTVRGQLWSIPSTTTPGRVHQLLVGDATQPDDIARLMAGATYRLLVTDPPYGVRYADKNRFLNAVGKGHRIQKPITADDGSPEDMYTLWGQAFAALRPHATPGAGYYVTAPQGGELLLRLLLALQEAGFPLRHTLIWAKNNHVLGRCDYHYQHEPILYGWVEGAAHVFNGGTGETSLWQIDRPHSSDLHPTMKPVALFERAALNGSGRGDIVCDAFAGSGTTLVACERTGRTAYAVEIDPGYAAVALQRLADMGLQPMLQNGMP